MRVFKLLSLMLVVIFVLSGCAPAASDLKIAILAPLSGPVPTFGVMTRDGALLAKRSGTPRAASTARRSSRSSKIASAPPTRPSMPLTK